MYPGPIAPPSGMPDDLLAGRFSSYVWKHFPDLFIYLYVLDLFAWDTQKAMHLLKNVQNLLHWYSAMFAATQMFS